LTEIKEKVVSKGTEEFKNAKASYLELFSKKYPKETIICGCMGMKTTQTEKLKEIPKPFSCPDLELYIWDSGAVAFFCERLGCLCSCCREDLQGEYPNYCPGPEDNWEDDW